MRTTFGRLENNMRKIYTKEEQQINHMSSDLINFVHDVENGKCSEVDIYRFFYDILSVAQFDSRHIVKILENQGEAGKEVVHFIKVVEGW